jgi:hypothetical protein
MYKKYVLRLTDQERGRLQTLVRRGRAPITWDEVRLTALAFHQVHTECGVWGHIEREEFTLVCWRERCKDLRLGVASRMEMR